MKSESISKIQKTSINYTEIINQLKNVILN